MSSDPFFRLEAERGGRSSADSPAACPWSGARIQPECLRIENNGRVRVALSMPAKKWFDLLNKLGETVQLSRNAVAVLGKLGATPEIADWRNPVLPRDREGLFAPNLAEYASLWAVRELSPAGLMHGLEARDLSGEAFQRIYLAGSARRDLFEQFVTDHQSPAGETGGWFSPNQAFSRHRCRGIETRIPWLRRRVSQGGTDARKLSSDFAARVLQAATEADFPVRTTLYNRALVNTAIWTPEGHEAESLGTGNDPQFFHGNDVGLHLNLPAATTWLWAGRCSCCEDQRWSIELGDARNRVCLAIMAGQAILERDWRDLLSSLPE
jgi:hypothetical protein